MAPGDGLLLSEQGWRLRIARAALVHAGRYVCLAANAAGQERREFDVVVHGEGGGHGGWLRGRDTGSWAGWGCATMWQSVMSLERRKTWSKFG